MISPALAELGYQLGGAAIHARPRNSRRRRNEFLIESLWVAGALQTGALRMCDGTQIQDRSIGELPPRRPRPPREQRSLFGHRLPPRKRWTARVPYPTLQRGAPSRRAGERAVGCLMNL